MNDTAGLFLGVFLGLVPFYIFERFCRPKEKRHSVNFFLVIASISLLFNLFLSKGGYINERTKQENTEIHK